MLLTIADTSSEKKNQFTVTFKSETVSKKFVLDEFISPLTPSFKEALMRYFLEYPLAPNNLPNLSNVAERTINVGRSLGDELLGEDLQLLHVKDIIEEVGYHNLNIKIVLAQDGYFEELWELIILPDTEYMLSSVVRSFVRVWSDVKDSDELAFNLSVVLDIDKSVNNLLGSENLSTEPEDDVEDKPLNVLYLYSKDGAGSESLLASEFTNMFFNIGSKGSYCRLNCDVSDNFVSLQQKIEAYKEDLHVFYYNGPLRANERKIELLIGQQWIDAIQLIDLLGSNKVPLLYISPVSSGYGDDISVAKKISIISNMALTNGIGNVIAFSQVTIPKIANHIFEVLLEKIAEGLSLAQAVIETRKKLQASTEYALGAKEPVSLCIWPMLVHYSNQEVLFFAKPSISDADSLSQYKSIHERLFGFNNTMLPPLLFNTSDGKLLTILANILRNSDSKKGSISVIKGSVGIGKTHLCHVICSYLASTEQIDFGFNFDLNDQSYTPSDMLGMVEGVIKVKSLEQNLSQVSAHQCCFVFDGFDVNNLKVEKHDRSAFIKLFEALVGYGQFVIIVGDFDTQLFTEENLCINLGQLTHYEQHQLAADVLIQKSNIDNDVPQLLMNGLKGNPWLIKKVLPLLNAYPNINLLIDGVKNNVLDSSQHQDMIQRFYAWQWNRVPKIWKNLLILCKDIPGLLLEMIMTVCDQKVPFLPAKKLLSILGDQKAQLRDGISILEVAGFIKRFPHGRTINTDCLPYLNTRSLLHVDDSELESQKKFLFSQVICEGVRVLAGILLKQPNSSIFNNLIINRRYWAKHLEIIWFENNYDGFFSTISEFALLLKQAGIENDLSEWKSDLLGRTQSFEKITNDQSKIAWLVLATSVLNEKAELRDIDLESVALQQSNWLETLDEEALNQSLPLFQQVVLLLDAYYVYTESWQARIKVLNKSEAIYLRHEAWQRLIWTWKGLAQSYQAIGELKKAIEVESQIIHRIPYEGSPAGFKTKQYLDVLISRVVHGSIDSAKELLQSMRQDNDNEQIQEVLDGIECDIHMAEKNYIETLPYYRKLWINSTTQNQQEVMLQLLER
jgi:tetratricopeptide (TPR) repeat protein